MITGDVPEPTSEQCGLNAKVYETATMEGYALWYPQMGGYVGKAVVLVPRLRNGSECFEVFVWHDDEFPFGEADDQLEPVRLHHCDADQFIRFGEAVKRILWRVGP